MATFMVAQINKIISRAIQHTFRPTVSDPMKVMCFIRGDIVNASACSGQQQTSCRVKSLSQEVPGFVHEITWTSSGECLQARRQSLMTSTNQVVDQPTFSEHLSTTPLPAKIDARMGDHALCRAENGISMRASVDSTIRGTNGSSMKRCQQQPQEAHNEPELFCSKASDYQLATRAAGPSRRA